MHFMPKNSILNTFSANSLFSDKTVGLRNTQLPAVRKTTGNIAMSTELQPVTEPFDHFETCTSTEVNAVITRAPSKSCEMDPIPTDVLKKFMPELLPYITNMCNSSLQQGSFPLSQRHAIIRPRLKKPGSDMSDVQNYRPVSNSLKL